MKKLSVVGWVGVVLFVQIQLATAGQLPSSLEQYQAEVRAELVTAPAGAVTDYLESCLAGANRLDGLEAGDPRLPVAFDALVKARMEADDKLTADTSGNPAVRAETAAYNRYLQPYRKAEYIALIRLQDGLLDRKYFQTETAKNANFIEGFVNGRLGLTRAEHEDVMKAMRDPHLGVSPWEAIFRLEPAVALNNGAQPAILGTAGLSYTFFPTVERATDPPSFRESFWSKYLKKSGGRVGVGAGWADGEPRLLLGTGVQVHAVAVWALYEPKDEKFLLGLGLSDLSQLKKVVGWFE